MPRLLACASTLAAAAATAPTPPLCVASGDGRLTVCVDATTGFIASLTPLHAATPWAVNATTLLGDGAAPVGAAAVSQAPAGGAITVVRRWAFAAGGGAPAGGAVVTETLSARAASVRWHAAVAGDAAAPWSVPLVTSVAFGGAASSALKAWAPWDRGSASGWSADWVDPLQPSDVLPGGWWTGHYRVGNARDGSGGDFVVAPLATVLSADAAALDAGVTIALAPTEVPMDVHLELDGAAGGLSFSRAHRRLSSFAPADLDVDLVGHEADWRAALAWSVDAWPTHWAPHNAEAFATLAGTGSYSWWLGSLEQDPPYAEMAYKTNWDLSGRFFPYMGMFLPPVAPGVAWLNDAEGTQPRANVTFDIIGSWYRKMADAGFTDVSYANVNEYGINVQLPPAPPPAAARRAALPAVDARYLAQLFARVARAPGAGPQLCEDSWQNASACLAEAFPDAPVTAAWDEIARRLHRSGPYVSWQNAIVVDPGVEGYHAFMLEQLARHIVYEDAFAGYIIDRSDWMDLTSLSRDDGVTFIPEAAAANLSGVAASLKVSYQRMAADLRAVLDAGPAAQAALRAAAAPGSAAHLGVMNGAGLMMMNLVGNARLDMFEPFDGIFSEGTLVSGAGLLGIMSPAILWTYNAHECCRNASWNDFYMQRHLLMKVMPMIPFPGNDHAIPFDAASAAFYVRYGAMMSAVAPAVWALFPHILSTVNGSDTTPAKVNAFIAPLDVAASDVALLVPVMLGVQADGAVLLNLTDISRVWPAAGPRASKHPLVRARAAARGAPAPAGGAGGAATYTLDALYPGAGAAWAPLGNFSADSFVVRVPLQSGAALVRARRVG